MESRFIWRIHINKGIQFRVVDISWIIWVVQITTIVTVHSWENGNSSKLNCFQEKSESGWKCEYFLSKWGSFETKITRNPSKWESQTLVVYSRANGNSSKWEYGTKTKNKQSALKMGIRANGNLGHLLARRQKLLEKHDLAFLQGKTLKKGFKRYTKCGTISWENRTRSLKVENKQRAMKMGIRANGNLGQHFQKQASKWDPICSRAYCSSFRNAKLVKFSSQGIIFRNTTYCIHCDIPEPMLYA